MSDGPVKRFLEQIDLMIRSRYAAIYVVTWEESRLESLLYDVARKQGKKLFVWTATSGLRECRGQAQGLPGAPRLTDPIEVLGHVQRWNGSGLFLLKDFHVCFETPEVVRTLKDVACELKRSHKNLILSAPQMKLPVELDKDLSIIDLPLPSAAELRELLRGLCLELGRRDAEAVQLRGDDIEALVRAAQGLTLSEAENAFAKAAVTRGVLQGSDVEVVMAEKQQVIRKSGMLEFQPADATLADVGGLEILKQWLRRRGKAWQREARDYGLPSPKGALLLGVPGCGKSLIARAVAQAWTLPLLHLDLARIFSSMLGSSEENMRRALAVAEGVAPAVLWIDEIEKGLAGGTGSGHSDAGTAVRVFGTLLTWMQERSAPVFVVATANKLEALPPELLRRGRFDEIFFVDLPGAETRAEILRIHLAKRNRDPGKFDLTALASACSGFSGAELEHVVIEALFAGFDADREIEDDDLLGAITQTTPLSTTSAEEVQRLREWARTRARPADLDSVEGDDG